METLNSVELTEAIDKGLANSMDYAAYKTLMQELVDTEATTGTTQTEAFVEYTKLSHRRMKRWDKTVKINEETATQLASVTSKTTWLIITESWCGDAAHVIPVLNKLADLNENIDLKLVLRDKNDALMNQFLTNGGKAIPKLVALSDSNEVLFTYGPRPSKATQLVLDYKEAHGALTPEFKEELQHWYNKDKGQTIISDILNLIK